MRTVFGSLEGVGPNTFGRIDYDLIPFYKHDTENGLITENEAYELICKFLITWDCHYDHDMIMSGYADHELENTYTIGGCDASGNAVYNEITKMLLKATRSEHIIFPKIKARFSSSSPKEYLNDICIDAVQGTSTILYSNDDAVIASLLRADRPLTEARDYMISGCWGIVTNQEKYDHGSYFNLLKPFEFALHNLSDKIQKVKIPFKVFDGSESFDEIYQTVLYNTELLLKERISITKRGGPRLSLVDLCPIFSATIDGCIENHRDYSQNGAKYRDDYLLMFGLPNIVDSLLAIKELCFERKKYTFGQMLKAIKANWNGYEEMRNDAIHCSGFGDGSDVSCSLANRFNNDLMPFATERKAHTADVFIWDI